MRGIWIIQGLLAACLLSGCANQPGETARTQDATVHDPSAPPYPDLTPPWLNPAVGTMNTGPHPSTGYP